VYFQQLDGSLSYATDLADTAHYYRQQERLLQHWTACFGDSIAVVRYEELVSEPRPVLAGLLDFLGLDWDDRCLEFQAAENPVKTASVWQVREKLHAASSGRWRNYAFALEGIFGAAD
jgi:LPS sulfotransferase NodH